MLQYDKKEFSRIKKACKASYKRLEPFRKNRLELIEQYVGAHYGDEGSKRPAVPLNIIALGVMIYARALASRRPNVMVNTSARDLTLNAWKLELGMNKTLEEIQFKRQMDHLVINAMFGIGIMKTGLMNAGSVEIDGQEFQYGKPYSRAVDMDDWVHDTCAREWEDASYFGNRYRVPLDYAQNLEILNGDARKKLQAANQKGYDDGSKEDKVEKLGYGEAPYTDEADHQPYCELWDIFLPRDQVILTFSEQKGIDEPLAVIESTGPKAGPYRILSYIDVPNNLMPVPPCAHWLDLHDLINSLMRKLMRQAEREKQFHVVKRGSEKDGERQIKVNDGEMIAIDDPQGVIAMKHGGADQQTGMFLMQCKQQLSWMAGNLDTLGGLSPQADTLGQEELLAQSSSKQLAEMQDRTVDCTRHVVRDLAQWMWADKFTVHGLTHEIGGTTIQTSFEPEDRTGDFLALNIDIEPFSMQDVTPGIELQKLDKFMAMTQQIFPILQQQGMMPNGEELLRRFAKFSNMQGGMNGLLIYQRPPAPTPEGEVNDPQSFDTQPPKPATTTRIEKRVSTSRASRTGQDALMAQMMAGSTGTQPKETALAMGGG